MRTEQEVEQFKARLLSKLDEDDPRVEYRVRCFEYGIPRSFWAVASNEVSHNIAAFKQVRKYAKRWRRARRFGYSMLLMGDNGTGKTMFMCWFATQMVKRGASVYYTTLTQLDVDIKRGFHDREAEARLRELLDCDFLFIDEMGKEYHKSDSYLLTRLELLLKTRYDDGEPVLMASNLEHEKFVDMYGSTIGSMLEGKYRVVQMETGDFRQVVTSKMNSDMGYDA